ncbi:MAG: LysR family transcriptional regulator [Parasporobacterium sp.]|nr:LysR family transcriptional regulator [Parasporobacterium sp.]
MTILQMEYFVEVAKQGSFSRAAEKLFVSQQGISKQIRAIESELGMSLIDRRNKRRVQLTKEGELLFCCWEKILKEYREALTEAGIQAGIIRKKIRIGIFEAGPVIDYVMPLINGYRFHHPDYDTECVFDSEEVIMQKLEEESIDIAFAFCEKYRNYSYHCIPIYYDRANIALSRQHPLASKECISLDDLLRENIYILAPSYSYDASFNIRHFLQQLGCSEERITEVKDVNNLEMALNMAQGITIAPRILLRNTNREILFFPFESIENSDAISLLAIWKKESCQKDTMDIIGQI